LSREDAEQLMDRWMNDLGFRTAMRADPVRAVQGTGVTLDADDTSALRAIDWTLSDEQLVERLSRAFTIRWR
jgi:hypothetical protein